MESNASQELQKSFEYKKGFTMEITAVGLLFLESQFAQGSCCNFQPSAPAAGLLSCKFDYVDGPFYNNKFVQNNIHGDFVNFSVFLIFFSFFRFFQMLQR